MAILSPLDWLKIIAYILKLIIDGIPKGEAVSMASLKFGVSKTEIWKRGGV